MLKRIVLCVLTLSVVAGAIAFSGNRKAGVGDLQIDIEQRNPWTHLRLNDAEESFHFVVVSDRTGGHRARVFSQAVEQINLLQPAFVISVGDLIEGYTKDTGKLAEEWKEFQTYTHKLQMPFFYVPGNHDVTNPEMEKIWEEKFGRRYYHFTYNGVLFLILNSDDPPASGSLSEGQVKWAKQVLADNANARWTIVAFHKPIWTGNIEKNGWGEVEKTLAGRNYTVFVGHVHRYEKFVRNGMNYYQLATTGGGSRLRGVRYGEFDHIVWVTMKKSGPVLANIMLDGVLPENLSMPDTSEPVTPLDRKATHPVKGWVYIDGVAAGGATISFYTQAGVGKTARFVGDAIVEGDGSFVMSSYGAFDGVPAGEYSVTVAFDGRYTPVGDRKNWVPTRYSKANTTPLKAAVKAGMNELTLEVRTEPSDPEPKGGEKK